MNYAIGPIGKPILDDYLQNTIYFKFLSLIVFAKKAFK